MYSSEDFGPSSRRSGRGLHKLAFAGAVLAAMVVLILFRGPVVASFRLWRLRSGSPEARASAWRGLVASGRGAEALTGLEYVEIAGFGIEERFVPPERSGQTAAPRIEFMHVIAISGEPWEDHIYVKLLGADETIIRYIPTPPKMLLWGRTDERLEQPDRTGCNQIVRLAFAREHVDIQLADSVSYAVEVNAANQAMRIRLRRRPRAKGAGYHVKLTPLEVPSRPELMAFIKSMKLSISDAAGPEPGDLATWVDYNTRQESFFLLKGEATERAAGQRAAGLAGVIDAANAEWQRSRGYAAVKKYRLEVVDAGEWPGVIKPLTIERGARRLTQRPRDSGLLPGAKYYTVKPGDVLSTIARRHGTTIEALVRANHLRNPDEIRVGQKLVIVKP